MCNFSIDGIALHNNQKTNNTNQHPYRPLLLYYKSIVSVLYRNNNNQHEIMAFSLSPHDIFAERYGPVEKRSRSVSYFPVHPTDIAMVMGKNGSTVSKIARDFRASIDFVPYTEAYPNTPPHFRIEGETDRLRVVEHKMSEICQENMRRQWKASAKKSEVKNSLTFECEDMRMVIGKNGHNIKGINKRYNMRSFTRPDEKDPKNFSVLDLIGYGPDVAAAKKYIHNIVYESRCRRGLIRTPEQQNEDMYNILKKHEDDDTIQKLLFHYNSGDEQVQKKYDELYEMISKTDQKLRERADKVIMKEQQDIIMIEKMATLWKSEKKEDQQEYHIHYNLIKKTDHKLMERIDEVCKIITMNKESEGGSCCQGGGACK